MDKKDDLPAMPFYVGDWLKAPDIQCLNYDLKGLWFEMLCYMWESKERGYLLYSKEELSRLLRLPEDLLDQKLKQLFAKGIYSIRGGDGAIYSRRMVRDQKIREIRTKAGSLGGRRTFAAYFATAKNQAKCVNENENEDVNKDVKVNKGVVRGGFKPPTLEEVQAYCLERNNGIDPKAFIAHYETSGWIRGKTPIKNWKACILTWEGKKNERTGTHNQNTGTDVERIERKKQLDSIGTKITNL